MADQKKAVRVNPPAIVITVCSEDGGRSTSEELYIYPFKNIKSDMFIRMAVEILGEIGLLEILGVKKPETEKVEERSITSVILEMLQKAPTGFYRLSAFTLMPNGVLIESLKKEDGEYEKILAKKIEYVENDLTKHDVAAIISAGIEQTGISDFFGALARIMEPFGGASIPKQAEMAEMEKSQES